MDDLCADFEQIMPIDEFALLEEAIRLKLTDITPMILLNTEIRYRRYILKINDWTDRKGTDYSYIKEKIYDFISEKMINARKKLMKYIDQEIMTMVTICRIDDMDI
jgi:hypothetical protein